MIKEEETFNAYGYYPSKLPPHSHRPIKAICDDCCKLRTTSKHSYRPLCNSCVRKGKKNPNYGISQSKEQKAEHSKVMKDNTCALGYKHTEKTRALVSKNHADLSGENNPAWLGGISFEPYCIKFNDEYKEYIRNFFGNVCFLCNRAVKENCKALSVHHVNYNKSCGCDDTKCLCVPLCIKCHSKTNGDRDYWQALITEMLHPAEAWE